MEKPITGYRIINEVCKIKHSGVKKMFKELPIIESDNVFIKALNYMVLYMPDTAVAETILERFTNVHMSSYQTTNCEYGLQMVNSKQILREKKVLLSEKCKKSILLYLSKQQLSKY